QRNATQRNATQRNATQRNATQRISCILIKLFSVVYKISAFIQLFTTNFLKKIIGNTEQSFAWYQSLYIRI
ncbi:hypothetical protein, partial [Capnocytophaga canimorsus]|uniref:hypothetical protein n=1 Tax=Capnocytophaga canimorsus TaxID=28188 RepID=UPI0028ECB30F